MFFVYNTQAPRHTYNPEDVYQDYRRREYIAALQEQHRRAQFEQELAREEERHRRALAIIARQEAERRQHERALRLAPRKLQQHASGACECGSDPQDCIRPDPREVYRRRSARQVEEEKVGRDFHRDILSRVFGVPEDDDAMVTPQASDSESPPVTMTAAPEGKDSTSHTLPAKDPTAKPAQEPSLRPSAEGLKAPAAKGPAVKEHHVKPLTGKETKGESPEAKKQTTEKQGTNETEPHWSAAPDRTKSLAEIAALNRTFKSLKNTFIFPSGRLEALPDSSIPRLAYNRINAAIHAYHHALADLLDKLDGIDSFGFKGVREARKQLVDEIANEMEILDKQIRENLTKNAAPTTDATQQQDAAQDVEMGDSNKENTTSTDATAPSNEDAEDVTMCDANDSSAPEMPEEDAAKHDTALDEPVPSSITEVVAESEKPAPSESVPEVVASTNVERLESQASDKEAMETDKSGPTGPNPSTTAATVEEGQSTKDSSQNLRSTPTKAKSPTISVSDEEEWEIADAVESVA